MERIVLAYSGGAASSAALAWLKERGQAHVIAVTVDVGQGGPLEEVRNRALAAGALRAHVLDVREEFARDFILRAVKADALHEERVPLVAAIASPLVAKTLVGLARIERAAKVAHGALAAGSEPCRLDVLIRSLAGPISVLAPLGELNLSRPQLIEFARSRGVPVPDGQEELDRVQSNLWGRAMEHHLPDDPWIEPPEDLYSMTRAPLDCPEEPAYVELAFERGVPVAVNGVPMSLVELITSLGFIASAHGVGRIDSIETRSGGRSREVCEAPAAVLLHAAHRELQKHAAGKELARFARTVSLRYADLTLSGAWFTPLHGALDAFVESVQQWVTGDVRLKLFKGAHRIVGRKLPSPQARTSLAATLVGTEAKPS